MALTRKLEVSTLIRELDAKISATKAVQKEWELQEIKDAILEDDNRLLWGASCGDEQASPGTLDDPFAYLTDLARALTSLDVVRNTGLFSWIEILPSLAGISAAQQRRREEWEAAMLEQLFASNESRLTRSWEAGTGQHERTAHAVWAVKLLEAAYQGRPMLSYFCSMQHESAGPLPSLEVIEHFTTVSVYKPAYCVLWCSTTKSMVVGVRGLDSLQDIVTALNAKPGAFLDGYCHSGALEASQWVLQQIRKHIDKYSPQELQLLGHSLGGAIAACLAVQLQDEWHTGPRAGFSPSSMAISESQQVKRASAVTFGTPPCFGYGQKLREISNACVITWVNGQDVVPRLSEANVASLLDRIRSQGSQQRIRQLLLPGNIYHIESLQGFSIVEQKSPEAFVGHIPLTPSFIRDHRLFSYLPALEGPSL
mmetsp:Transcript_30794/g.87094  ORF Transcript_30794/g.87094 Transcript_30794/m.87094 type:complete len:425 (-) Transcript_30794:245-1519(-)